MNLKPYDVVANLHAGNSNPNRVLVYLNSSSEFHNFSNCDGEFVQFYKNHHKLKKQGFNLLDNSSLKKEWEALKKEWRLRNND